MDKLDILFGKTIGKVMNKIRRNVFVYDLEVYENLFSAGFLSPDQKEYHLFVLHEGQDDIQKLRDWIDSFDGNLTLIGHNALGYDNLILNAIFEYAQNISNASLKRLSDKIIERGDAFKMSDIYKQLRWYATERWITYDTMEITRVNQMRVALKFAGVILKLNNIQDLPYEPSAILTPAEIQEVISYMRNDIETTLELWNSIQNRVKTRHNVEELYGVDVHSLNDTGVGKAILDQIYTDKTRISIKQLKESVPEPPHAIQLKNCIAKDVLFETDVLNNVKHHLGESYVYNFNYYKNTMKFEEDGTPSKNQKQKHAILFDGIGYTIGSGGLHSVDTPAIYKTDENHIIRDCDVASYYPNIIIQNGFTPSHLGQDFVDILASITEQRIDAKGKAKSDAYFAVMDASLKITINSIFGLLGNKYYWLYSPQTMLSVTLSGQMLLLDLIEKLSLKGIPTISANTDGIVCQIPRELESEYYQVCEEWEQRTKMVLEYTDYDLYARRDVNNYITVKPYYEGAKEEDLVKTKGIFYAGKFNTETQRWMPPLNKGYDSPITSIALLKYYSENIPVEETIMQHTDLHDFIIAKRVDTKKYTPTLQTIRKGKIVSIPLQKTNRLLVTKTGGSIEKVSFVEGLNSTSILAGKRITVVNTIDNEDITAYNIDYQHYISETYKVLDQIEPKTIMLF